jgi:hypothetical protein
VRDNFLKPVTKGNGSSWKKSVEGCELKVAVAIDETGNECIAEAVPGLGFGVGKHGGNASTDNDNADLVVP